MKGGVWLGIPKKEGTNIAQILRIYGVEADLEQGIEANMSEKRLLIST